MPISSRSERDRWIKCLSSKGTIRAVAVSAKDTCAIITKRHHLSQDGTQALSEAVVAGLLLASFCKSNEKINLNIQGQGWTRQAIVDANSEGQVRGYALERKLLERDNLPDIGPWGTGLMSVLRTKYDHGQPYIGTVPLLTGHLAKDLTFYWVQSEQIPSAVGIQVSVDESGITLAEGFLIQAMPGATDEDLSFIEEQFKSLSQMSIDSAVRETPLSLLSYLLQDFSFSILEDKNIEFSCNCSKERVERSLKLIGNEELRSMAAEKHAFEIKCDFCAEVYWIDEKDLNRLIAANS